MSEIKTNDDLYQTLRPILGQKEGVEVLGDEPADELSGLRVVFQSYGWALGGDGRLHGLVAGDMGYAPTHIVIEMEHILAVADSNREDKAIAEAGGLRAAIMSRRARRCSFMRDDGGMDMKTAIGTYLIEPDGWTDPLSRQKTPAESRDLAARQANEHFLAILESCFDFEDDVETPAG